MHLTHEDVRALLTADNGTVVSIYISTEPKTYRPEQNSLRFRSALDTAAKKLEKRGFRRPDCNSLMRPLKDLLHDERFWLHQANGLALFCSQSKLETVRLHYAPTDNVRVSDAPYVVPLLEGLENGERHALLAISKNAIRLFSCTRGEIEEIDTGMLEMPRSLADALRYDDLQKPELLNHPSTGPGRAIPGQASRGRGERRHAFHGHGESDVQEKDHIANYLHLVDAALQSRLHDLGSPPLLLAAVDYISAIYRSISKYRPLSSTTIEGNPDGLRPDQLHARAKPILETGWRSRLDDARSRFEELAARGLATAELSEVVDAADTGRVDTLLAKKGSSAWGRLDASTRTVTLTEEDESESEDLMDFAARRTLTNKGTVLVLDPELMVDGEAPAAATLRY
jgi:Bacterial archaeo-eukaryotic release factor family 7